MRFICAINKFTDITCDKTFINEMQLHTHMLFEHNILMPICSTGIEEKLFKDNMELIKQYRNARFMKDRSKHLLKKRLLKSMYGKEYDLSNIYQTNYFLTSLDNHDKHIHNRIEFINHEQYDKYRDLESQLAEKLRMKGIVNR